MNNQPKPIGEYIEALALATALLEQSKTPDVLRIAMNDFLKRSQELRQNTKIKLVEEFNIEPPESNIIEFPNQFSREGSENVA